LGMKTMQYLPSHRGFDRYFGYYSGVMDYFTHGMAGPWPHSGGLDLHEGGPDFHTTGKKDNPVYGTHGNYSSPMFADKAAEWIEQHGQSSSQPMFMYFAFQGCHSGDNKYVQAPNYLKQRFDSLSPDKTCGNWEQPLTGNCTKAAMRKTVAACVTSVDDAVLTVTGALKKAGMYDDTLIVLSTDNGGPTDGADGNNMNNFPLRGCKGGYFDGGMRGVGLVHGAGLASSVVGTVSNALHHVTDWLPTLLTAAKQGAEGGVEHRHTVIPTGPGEVPFKAGDGMDNWASLSQGVASARTEIIHVVQAQGSVLESHAIRSGDLKLLWHPAGTDCSRTHPGWYPPPGRSYNYANFTIKCERPPTSLDACTKEDPCLFNITADPCEHHNLASQMPSAVTALSKKIDGYRETTVLPWLNFHTHSDPRSNPAKLGPTKDGYQGLYGPWLANNEDVLHYPTNYSGPGY